MDVSFISATLVLPAVLAALAPAGLPERVPVLSITGAPISSESAREGIELTIFDVPDLVAILLRTACKVPPATRFGTRCLA